MAKMVKAVPLISLFQSNQCSSGQKHFVLSESNNLTIGPRIPVEIWRIKLCTKIHVIYKKKIKKMY
jgi:hypothetical protein